MILYGRDKRNYVLEKEMHSGAEGIIYEIKGDPGHCAKVYKDAKIGNPQDRRETYNKLSTMLNIDLGYSSSGDMVLAWPKELLFDAKGEFQGFIMSKVPKDKEVLASIITKPEVFFQNYRWSKSVIIAYNLSLTVEKIHSRGVVIGDWNYKNFMFDGRGLITLVDTDSFSVKGQDGHLYRCTAGWPECEPPEIQGKDMGDPRNLFTEETDRFALAVVIFRLLCNKQHPFGVLCKDPSGCSSRNGGREQNIVTGYCAYVTGSTVTPSSLVPDMAMFPSEIRKLFDRAFKYTATTAVRAETIANRPTAREWREALYKLIKSPMQKCGKGHEYPKSYTLLCPWCAVEKWIPEPYSIPEQIIISDPDSEDETDMSDFEFETLQDGTVEITKYTGTEETVVLPKAVNGRRVTSVGEEAFQCCDTLITVVIKDGITVIKDYAFSGCEVLKNVTLPETLTSIGFCAFSECPALQNVHLPGRLVEIGESAFMLCESIKEIDIPDSVVSIGEEAFGWSGLNRVMIGSGVREMGGFMESNPFKGCRYLHDITVSRGNPTLETIAGILYFKPEKRLVCYPPATKDAVCYIPEGTESIGGGAFCCAQSLKKVKIPSSISEIRYDAFQDSGIEVVDIPSGVDLSGGTFSDCTELIRATLPDDITEIPYNMFDGCTALTEISIPSGVTKVGNYAFKECKALKSVRLPYGVTEIGDYAFEGCTALVEIYVPPTIKKIGKKAFDGVPGIR